MMSLQKLLPLFLFSLILLSTSCDKEDEHMDHDNEVTITILSPTADEVVGDASSVEISIEISATDENHELEIVLHPDGDTSDKILDVDMHDHDKVITFQQTVDLSSYPAGTGFHLEVEACVDHDCEEKATADVEFSIP